MIVIPMLTMRLYAEEKRGGTYELLMTSPITSAQILIGKFLACYVLYLLIEAMAFGYIGILSMHAQLDWGSRSFRRAGCRADWRHIYQRGHFGVVFDRKSDYRGCVVFFLFNSVVDYRLGRAFCQRHIFCYFEISLPHRTHPRHDSRCCRYPRHSIFYQCRGFFPLFNTYGTRIAQVENISVKCEV